MRLLKFTGFLVILLSACSQMDFYHTCTPITGENLHIKDFDCGQVLVAKTLTDTIKIELLKKQYPLTDEMSADLFLTGTIVLTTSSNQVLGGFTTSGTGSLYGSGSANTYISSAVFYVKDKNDEIIIAGSYKVSPGWDLPASPVEVGRKIGKQLAQKLKKLQK